MSPSPSEWPVFLIIHGHFYQPPRENPWINRIERQDSAAPYHDWNERITAECYRANCFSRRLDGFGRIEEIVDNFAYMSFNVGPTLFSYLEREHPDVYARIVEGDRLSAERWSHGNAMAQVYNHVIMPLADARDQETQVVWGIADFEYRFGRKPRGMWLAETAINDKVVDVLIEHGIEYVILSPHQAQRVRPLDSEGHAAGAGNGRGRRKEGDTGKGAAGGGKGDGRGRRRAKTSERRVEPKWTDVSDGSIDTSRAYRIVRGGGRFLDVFFFDLDLSRAVSFEGLLRDANLLADRIYSRVEDVQRAQLITIATDGETFGHHHPFGDMCIAALVRSAASSRGLTLTNPSQYLSRVPVTWEVELKKGERGEGTAWSCAHGVGRWYRDCGCSTGGREGWTQAWRRPLREGLDHLKDELRRVFVRYTSRYFHDPWKARNDWIGVMLDGYSEKARNEFFERNLAEDPGVEGRADLCSLLEAQKYAMYMFTSCGWFFSEISGIETVQNLKYAARAIELTRHFSPIDFEEILKCHLRRAPSNIEKWRNGAVVYEELVKAYAGEDRQLAFNLLIEELFLAGMVDRPRYLSDVKLKDHDRVILTGPERSLAFEQGGGGTFTEAEVGRFSMYNRVTGHHRVFDYLALKGPNLELEVYINQSGDTEPGVELDQLAEALFAGGGIESVRSQLVAYFKAAPFGAEHIFFDLRQQLVDWVIRDVTSELGAAACEVYDRYRSLAHSIRAMGLPLPELLVRSFQGAYDCRLERWMRDARESDSVPDLSAVGAMAKEAAGFGIDVGMSRVGKCCTELLVRWVRELAGLIATEDAGRVASRVEAIERLLDQARDNGIELDRQVPEEELDLIIGRSLAPLALSLADSKTDMDRYRICNMILGCAERLNFSPSRRQRLLGNFERSLANDPELWP